MSSVILFLVVNDFVNPWTTNKPELLGQTDARTEIKAFVDRSQDACLRLHCLTMELLFLNHFQSLPL